MFLNIYLNNIGIYLINFKLTKLIFLILIKY